MPTTNLRSRCPIAVLSDLRMLFDQRDSKQAVSKKWRHCNVIILLSALAASPPSSIAASVVKWEPILLPLEGASVTKLTHAPALPARVYAACDRAGVYRSDDWGDTWALATHGLPFDGQVDALISHPLDPNIVIAGVQGDVYRTSNGGASWELWEDNPSAQLMTPAAISSDGSALLLKATPNGGPGLLVRSTDQGKSWVPADSGLEGFVPHEVSFNPSDPLQVVACVWNDAGGVFRSSDGGISWTRVTLPGTFVSISWSAADPNVIYALQFGATTTTIHRSSDAGLSFQAAGTSAGMADPVLVRASNGSRHHLRWGAFGNGVRNTSPHSARRPEH